MVGVVVAWPLDGGSSFRLWTVEIDLRVKPSFLCIVTGLSCFFLPLTPFHAPSVSRLPFPYRSFVADSSIESRVAECRAAGSIKRTGLLVVVEMLVSIDCHRPLQLHDYTLLADKYTLVPR